MLAAGRALHGGAVALTTGASAAALRIILPSRPDWASRFTLMATAGGVVGDPVIGGLLSLLPTPTRTPFIVYLVVLASLLVPLLLLRARPAIKPVSAVYVIANLGSAVPVLRLGAAAGRGLDASVTVFAVVISGICAVLGTVFAVGSAVNRSRATR